jgi:hypothetical protein
MPVFQISASRLGTGLLRDASPIDLQIFVEKWKYPMSNTWVPLNKWQTSFRVMACSLVQRFHKLLPLSKGSF